MAHSKTTAHECTTSRCVTTPAKELEDIKERILEFIAVGKLRAVGALQPGANAARHLFRGLKNVRVPKRYDGRARGFAFVEYERASDASSARRALGSAHLYGRHLVIDWAENEGAGGS